MVQHARLIFYSLLLLVIPCESTLAQKIPVTPIDSLITVGYATGSLKTLSGSVEKINPTSGSYRDEGLSVQEQSARLL